MNKYLTLVSCLVIALTIAYGCKKNSESSEKETILKGTASILTDETVMPIMEDQVAVFESSYNAKIKLISKSENEIINSLLNGDVDIAILSRRLSEDELKTFSNRKISPKTTGFATDAIAFISNSRSNDTLIDLTSVIDFLNGKNVPTIKGLVFDNPNSSTVRYLDSLAGKKAARKDGIFSFSSNTEAIKYVAANDGLIGVVGLSWLTQPSEELAKLRSNIKILSVRGSKSNEYVSPTQNNIAEGKYPLARDLFIVNCQGFAGLGVGFGSFIAGERGQRIILKSGLLPIRIPGRKILIRNNIEKENVKN